MRMAVCFKYGSEIYGPHFFCGSCSSAPQCDGGITLPFALGDHTLSKPKLVQCFDEISNHLRLCVQDNVFAKASEALKAPQQLAMLVARPQQSNEMVNSKLESNPS